jgi:threonine aldolase
VVFDVAQTGVDPQQAALKLFRRGVLVIPFGRTRLRAVTHLDVDDAGIEMAGRSIREIFAQRGRRMKRP